MFKLAVLSALLSFALAAPAPAPSGLVAPIAYAAGPSVAVVHAAPAVYHAPIALAAPAAISTQSNTVIHGAKAAIVQPLAYAAHHPFVAAPIIHAW